MSAAADPIMSDLERTVRRNALRYHVGAVMFCPTCSGTLDVSRAVEVDYTTTAGDLARTLIYCAACFDAGKAPGEATGLTREVADGRVLFPPPAPRAPRKPTAKRAEPTPGATYLVKHSSGEVK